MYLPNVCMVSYENSVVTVLESSRQVAYDLILRCILKMIGQEHEETCWGRGNNVFHLCDKIPEAGYFLKLFVKFTVLEAESLRWVVLSACSLGTV